MNVCIAIIKFNTEHSSVQNKVFIVNNSYLFTIFLQIHKFTTNNIHCLHIFQQITEKDLRMCSSSSIDYI